MKITTEAANMRNLRNADVATSHMNQLQKLRRVIACGLFCLIGLLLPVSVWAEGVGTITHLGGTIRVTRADGTSKILSVKSEIREGDTLRTEKNTFARIKFVDGGEVVLRPETVFKVDAYSYQAVPTPEHKDNVLFGLVKGGMRSVTGLLGKRSPDAFKMNTATATIGIRGTHFGVLMCNNDCGNIPTATGHALANGMYTDTAQGTVVVSNAGGSVVSTAGTFTYTPDAGTAPKMVPPSEGVQVTMPPSISNNKGNGGGMGKSDSNSCTVN